ncbi:hypothetical protein [Rugamonas apoptosis]|uniref:Uncharacterized protein n=1 Tax=Rugamonas apoptosis TaxID=2758570 RepID=A0A7W2FAV1_9BURK|nr:hypothetical protein [Rugamonas apoptosis]MBA5688363.1 hypothetical protein [Rugamonas apoptosis]
MSYPIPVHLPNEVFHVSPSPSQFVNAYGCGTRTWSALWLRFPGEARWRLAADCRDAARDMVA